MARPRKWESEAERLAAYRERKALELEGPDLPVVQIDEEPEPVPLDEEQAIRDEFGYSSTERRSKAERDAAAQRMLAAWSPSAEERAILQQVEDQLRARAAEHERRQAAYRRELRKVPAPS